LDAFFDSVSVEVTEEDSIDMSVDGVGAQSIPITPGRNTAGIVARTLLGLSDKKYGLTIRIKKGIRLGRGLGSSAASATAAAFAINEALELNLPKKELVKFAAQGEIASAGAPHADNVAPAMLGFFTIVTSYNPLEVTQLPSPSNVELVLAIPEVIKGSSASARSILPKQVRLSDLVHNVGHATTFVAGIALNDVDLMGRGMADSVVEPARAHLIPGMADVRKSALEAGAAGFAISGAGPSVLALVNAEKKKTASVAQAMREAFGKHGVQAQVVLTRPGPGAKIVKREES